MEQHELDNIENALQEKRPVEITDFINFVTKKLDGGNGVEKDPSVMQNEAVNAFFDDTVRPAFLHSFNSDTLEGLDDEDVYDWLDELDTYVDDELQAPIVERILKIN